MTSQKDMPKIRLEQYKRYLKKEEILYRPAVMTQEKQRDTPTVTCAYVLGPMLNAFIIWVLQNALRAGKKRLYFLARDGYLMYQTAEIYVRRLNLPIECRYLSCSRYSLRIPMFRLDMEDAMEYICRDSIGVNLSRILGRAGLTEDEQEEVLKDIGEEGHGNESIPYVRLAEVKEKLWHCEVFMEYMLRHSKEAAPGLTGYLAQEGLLDGEEDFLVDSGWVGSMQKTLNQVLENMGRKKPLEGFYWGIYELPPGVKREEYHCYYFGPEGQLGEKVNFNNNLFETIFSAPHGMTLGYEKRGEQYVPIYAPVSSDRKKYMEKLSRRLEEYTRRAAEQIMDLDDADTDSEKKTMKKILTLFMGRPTRGEAEAYGSLGFCDDVLEYADRPLAEEMDEKDLRDNHVINKILVMLGIRKKEIRESAWYEGSAVRFGKRPGYHLIQYGLYKYLLYIRQMYMWRKSNVRKKED